MKTTKIIAVTNSLALGAGFALLQACASTPGARPQDMSVAQHEQAAGAHEAQAGEHAGQFNPNAQASTSGCGGSGMPETACWTDVTNPTKVHSDDAEQHRKMAADHRAAAQALRDAEVRSCAGLSDYDRDNSPFAHSEDIQSASPIHLVRDTSVETIGPTYAHVGGKNPGDRLTGAVVVFRAVRGLTAEYLQRVVNCHIARNNALGNNVPEMSFCPLAVKGVSANVTSAGDGFAVNITSQDPAAAQEVLRRANALQSRR
jgi:hypothetical protein